MTNYVTLVLFIGALWFFHLGLKFFHASADARRDDDLFRGDPLLHDGRARAHRTAARCGWLCVVVAALCGVGATVLLLLPPA